MKTLLLHVFILISAIGVKAQEDTLNIVLLETSATNYDANQHNDLKEYKTMVNSIDNELQHHLEDSLNFIGKFESMELIPYLQRKKADIIIKLEHDLELDFGQVERKTKGDLAFLITKQGTGKKYSYVGPVVFKPKSRLIITEAQTKEVIDIIKIDFDEIVVDLDTDYIFKHTQFTYVLTSNDYVEGLHDKVEEGCTLIKNQVVQQILSKYLTTENMVSYQELIKEMRGVK